MNPPDTAQLNGLQEQSTPFAEATPRVSAVMMRVGRCMVRVEC